MVETIGLLFGYERVSSNGRSAAERGKVGVSELVNTLGEEVVTEGGFSDGISCENIVGKLEGY